MHQMFTFMILSHLPAVLNSSKSTPAPILSSKDGMPPAPPIILDMLEEDIEVEEEDDIIVDDEDEKDLELELIILEPDIMELKSPPPPRLIIWEPPPMLIPSIIFFIMSSISRDIGPPANETMNSQFEFSRAFMRP